MAEQRLLIVSDVVGATQTVNFARPFAEAMQRGEAELKFVSASDLEHQADHGTQAIWAALRPTALILSRYSAGGHEVLAGLARAAGVPIVFHIDDDLFAAPQSLGAAKHLYYSDPKRLADLRAAMEASDLVYASTPILADRLRGHGVTRPIIAGEIGCAVDPGRFPVAAHRALPVIGYMASSGHLRDIELVLPAIAVVLDEFPGATMEVFGSLRLPKAMRRSIGNRLVQRDPLQDYDAFLNRLGELGWWLGLAPLEHNPFNDCKTEIKWLEYSFAGIPTLSSDTPVYRACCSGGAGLIAPDDSCWASAMRTLLSHGQLRSDIAAQARAKVARDYTLERLRRQVEDVLAAAAEVAVRRAPARPSDATPDTESPDPSAPVRPTGPRPKEYERWIADFDQLSQADRWRLDELAQAFRDDGPVICVALLPGASPASEADQRRSAESVRAQIYPNCTLVSPDPSLTDFADLLARAEGDYVCFLEAGDVLAPHALMALALEAGKAAADGGPEVPILYADEDEIDIEGQRSRPWFKGDFDPDLLLGQDYISRLAMLPMAAARATARGPLRLASVYALVLRLLAEAPEPRVSRLPLVLYHRMGDRVRDETDARIEHDAVADHLTVRAAGRPSAEVRSIPEGRRIVWPTPRPGPMVSLVMPTRDGVGLLRNCVQGLLQATDYPALELILVDNDSAQPETFGFIASILSDPRVRYFYQPGPFNYSALNNFGVRQARGEVIGLVNNDLEVIEPGWLTEMVSQALRPEVGAVGPLLYYGDGTVQHAGVVLGIGGAASHIFKRQPADSTGYRSRLALTQELSAVTGACMVLRREVWDEACGLEEDLPVAFNDVDLCLRLRALGYRNIFTPFARLRHLESASRGKDLDLERRTRFDHDVAKMRQRWGAALASDPFFSPNLSLRSVDARPAFPPRVIWPWWERPSAGAPHAAHLLRRHHQG